MHYAGARYYMSALGRFGVVDPMADSYREWSSYHYAGNNPIRITDPTGQFWVDRVRGTGRIRAARYGRISGLTFSVAEHGSNAIPILGSFAAGGVKGLRDYTIRGNTEYSTLDESNSDWALDTILSRIPSSMTDAFSKLMDLEGLYSMVRDLRVDEVAFKSLAEVDPTIIAGGSIYHLLSDSGDGAFTLGLNPRLQAYWGKGKARDKFAEEIGYVRSVARDLIESGQSVGEATTTVTNFLEGREQGVNVKDDAEACQFVANSLAGFSVSDC